MRQSKMLKVVGILLIIFSSMQILSAFGRMGGSYSTSPEELAQLSGSAVSGVESFILIITGIYQLAVGIVGVASSKKPERANGCLVMGSILIAFVLLHMVFMRKPSDPYEMGGALYQPLSALVLGILYTIGAHQLRNKQFIKPEPRTEYRNEMIEEKAVKKSTMLKVTGILFIIFAAFQILAATFMSLSVLANSQSGAETFSAAPAVMIGVAIVDIVFGIYRLAAGITGIVTSNKPEKANRCLVLGIVAIVLVTLSIGVAAISGEPYALGAAIIGAMSSLTLAILYTIGAFRLRKMQSISHEPDNGIYQ